MYHPNSEQSEAVAPAAPADVSALPKASSLYQSLRQKLQHAFSADASTHLVGITSGGAILAAALRADLLAAGVQAAPHGIINASLHRDDFGARGLASAAAKAPTHLPFDVSGAHVVLVDDVLYTGRTLRAVINELFDYGRPARISLCVLLDRGAEARELPFAPTFAAHSCTLPHGVSVDLSGTSAADFAWQFSARHV